MINILFKYTLDSLWVDILRYVMNTLLWIPSWREAASDGKTDSASKFLAAEKTKTNSLLLNNNNKATPMLPLATTLEQDTRSHLINI